jgi:hypothetical protein
MDDVLARVAAVVPADVRVLVLAERAFGIPLFADRVATSGWHWIVRAKAESELRFRVRFGQEADLAGLVRIHIQGPNRRWKIRGNLFTKAYWRLASVVAVCAAPCDDLLVVLTDLPACWDVIATYRRRFWTEPGFRHGKTHGWQWEIIQVVSLERHHVLLLAFAWATLLALCLGVTAARERLATLAHQPCRKRPHDHGIRRPQHARSNIFSLGLQRIRRYLYRTLTAVITSVLPDPAAPSWNDHWFTHQFQHDLFETGRP